MDTINLTQSTTPVEIDNSIYYIKNSLGWYDKDTISSASELVPAEGVLKEKLIELKEKKGLTYTEKVDYDPETHFSDNDLFTFKDMSQYSLTKITTYIHQWVKNEKPINVTPANVKLIPRSHFNKIREKIEDVESQSSPFQGEKKSKG